MSEGRHPFLDSSVPDPTEPSFTALGSTGSSAYVGLETFPNPGVVQAVYHSDEVMARCPITRQPDFYTVSIMLKETQHLIESKSLKLWFQNLMEMSFGSEFGIFCESLAVYIRDQVIDTLNLPHKTQMETRGETEYWIHDTDNVTVKLLQKSRGGISIEAIA